MDRRRFLAATAAAPPALLAAPRAEASPGRAQIVSYVTAIAETNGERALPAEGAPLRLSVDHDRAYDPGSVLVTTAQGQRLGYLPPMHGQTIAPLLAAGFVADARAGGGSTHPRQRLRIVIGIGPSGSA
jgi:hypothetical protein